MTEARRTPEPEEGGPRVVIVEERDDDIYSIRFVLQSLGYSVRSVAYVQGYLELVGRLAPELAIVDMLIPARGGFDAVASLHKAFKKLPILAITADAMDGDEKEVKKGGATVVIRKPYSVPDLQKVLKKYLK